MAEPENFYIERLLEPSEDVYTFDASVRQVQVTFRTDDLFQYAGTDGDVSFKVCSDDGLCSTTVSADDGSFESGDRDTFVPWLMVSERIDRVWVRVDPGGGWFLSFVEVATRAAPNDAWGNKRHFPVCAWISEKGRYLKVGEARDSCALADHEVCSINSECRSGDCVGVSGVAGLGSSMCKPKNGFRNGIGCLEDVSCASRYCKGVVAVDPGVCVAKAGSYEGCSKDQHCVSNECSHTSTFDKVCEPEGGFANGKACMANDSCKSGYCDSSPPADGVCRARVDPPGICDGSNDHCAEGAAECSAVAFSLPLVAERYRCKPSGGFALRAECVFDDDCASGYCTGSGTYYTTGECKTPKEDYDPCTWNAECRSNACTQTTLLGGFVSGRACSFSLPSTRFLSAQCIAAPVPVGVSAFAACESGSAAFVCLDYHD